MHVAEDAAADLHFGHAGLARCNRGRCRCRRSSRSGWLAAAARQASALAVSSAMAAATMRCLLRGIRDRDGVALPADHAPKRGRDAARSRAASAATAGAGLTPARCMPISTSMTTGSERRGRARGAASSATLARLSTATDRRCGRAARDQAAHLGRPDDLVGDQDVGKAGGGHGLGLAELGAGDAGGAGGELLGDDLGSLVALDMRPPADAVRRQVRRRCGRCWLPSRRDRRAGPACPARPWRSRAPAARSHWAASSPVDRTGRGGGIGVPRPGAASRDCR